MAGRITTDAVGCRRHTGLGAGARRTINQQYLIDTRIAASCRALVTKRRLPRRRAQGVVVVGDDEVNQRAALGGS